LLLAGGRARLLLASRHGKHQKQGCARSKIPHIFSPGPS
jgi:hypothetical protein